MDILDMLLLRSSISNEEEPDEAAGGAVVSYVSTIQGLK